MQQQSSKTQNYDIQLQFFHPRIGERKFPATNNHVLAQFRSGLQVSSELFLFTNYHFQFKGTRINEIEPIGAISTERQIKVDIVFGIFDFRSAQFHVSKTMQCIFNPDFYVFLCKADKQDTQQSIAKNQSKSFPKFQVQNLKPDLVNPFLVAQTEKQQKAPLLKSFSLSGFNPAPVSQKLNGDLFYLHVRTLENFDIHITASPGGFYVNQSKISYFNPSKSPTHKGIYGSLIDLLKVVSQKFKETIEILVSETKISDAMKYKFYSMQKIKKKEWLGYVEHEHGWNTRRNVEDHLRVELLNMKDWNEIFQSQYEAAIRNGKDNIEMAGQLSKTYSQFELMAREGATYIIDGRLAPLNPTDQKKKHIYIFNKIFFSIANETDYDHSLEKGEDATPSSSSINTDLINMEVLFNLGIPELHVLHMAIVNYRGFKVIAQCIIPGILSIDQMNCCQYGSIDDGKTIEDNPDFDQIMRQVCEKLGICQSIHVLDAKGAKKIIAGSPDVKGILGSDHRKYILDLLRLSPRDLNYQGPQHQACVVRPELIRNYRRQKGNQKNKLNVNIGTDIKFEPSEDHGAQVELLKDLSQYIRRTAILSVIDTLKNYPSQYLTNNEGISRAFHYWGVNMRYLGEVCDHPAVKDEAQIRLVLQRVIFVRSVKHLLRMAMRESNIAHLGSSIVNILNCIFARKNHLLYIQEGIIQSEEPLDKNADKDAKRKKKKKIKQQINQPLPTKEINQVVNIIKLAPNKFEAMKPQQIWLQICKLAKARFSFVLSPNPLAFEVFKFPFQKVAALRDICLSVGLVLQRKNYDIFEQGNSNLSHQFSDKVLPFNIKNIVSLQPIVKRMKIEPTNLMERERQSQQLISAYQVKEALKIDSALERQNISISGGLNEPAVKLFTRMGRILYILGQNRSAILQQEKNISMLQSLHCQDHWLNIQSHINLGLYYIAEGDRNKVIQYMAKGIYLMLIAFGETSPDLLVSFANLARIYHMNKEYKEAIQCYRTALKFVEQVHGKYHVKMSFCYTSLATICYEMADIRLAIQCQTQNVAILSRILPENDSKLQDAQKILRMYKEMFHKSEMQNNMASLAKISENNRKNVNEEEKDKKKSKKN